MISRVEGRQLADSGEPTVLQSMSGKLPGVQVTGSTGDPGAGSRIVLRGPTTITGSTQPLFVIDGVPVSNQSFGNGTAGVAQQSRINDVNPEDIASVEVLKGASAAALYGSRAANGVVLITTKKGRGLQSARPSVTIRSSLSVDQVNQTIPLQNSYGQGSFGWYNQGYNRPAGTSTSWGDRIADREGGADDEILDPGFYAVGPNGQRFGAIAPGDSGAVHGGKNSRETFDQNDIIFGTGLVSDNSVSISGGDEISTYLFSAGYLSQGGVVQANSNYKRATVRLNADRRFTEKLKIGVTANYVNTTSDRVQGGSNLSGIMLGGMRTPPDFNGEAFEVFFVDETGTESALPRQRAFRNPLGERDGSIYDNPLWTAANVLNNTTVNRFTGSSTGQYFASNWLTFTGRLGVDTYFDRRNAFYPVLASEAGGVGDVTEEEYTFYQVNADVFGEASHSFSPTFGVSGLLGFNLNHRKTDNIGISGGNFIAPVEQPVVDITQVASRVPVQDQFTVREAALYSEVAFDVADQLFTKFTGRAESSSTFGPDASSTFFFPSAQVAWDLSEYVDGFLTLAKLRAAVGQVGSAPEPYLIQTPVLAAAATDGGWGPSLNPANYGGGLRRTIARGNREIKPEITTEVEVGGDFRFLDDRASLSATYYNKKSTDVILDIDVPSSTGFLTRVGNVAEIRNRGVELSLDLELLRQGSFGWSANVNWAFNRNKVLDLEGAESFSLAGFTGTSSRVAKDAPYGAIWGGAWRRDTGRDEERDEPLSQDEIDEGFTIGDDNIVLDPDGFPTAAASPSVIGNPEPDWQMGITNQFRFKGFRLSALVDIKRGGDVWNGTRGALYVFGTHEDTAVETILTEDQLGIVNYAGDTVQDLIDQGAGYVQDLGDGTYRVRGEVVNYGGGDVLLDQFWWSDLGGGFGPVAEPFVEDASYVRLREVSLGYTWDSDWLRQRSGLTAIEFNFTARNLLTWTDYRGIDPNTNLTGASNGYGLDYFQNPLTRSYITTLRVVY